jgi:hypothetical protein
MADDTDKGQEKEEKIPEPPVTPLPPSDTDWEAKAKHFQSIADQRDATNNALKTELDKIRADQEAANKKELEEKEEYQKLYQQEQAKVAANAADLAKLNLQVQLQAHLSEKAPDYVPDYKWIAPHVDSAENLASVVEDYVKAHPRTPGTGTASLGNRGKESKGAVQVTKADLNNPIELAKLRAADPKFDEKLLAGEIDVN